MESKSVRIEELLAHAGWVRRLAARLVRDDGTADDVAQEVWAYALRSPPRDRTNLRAWLSAAVRNAARSLQRSQSRRAEREAVVATRDHAPAAAELVERAQLHRDLVEQVLSLEEPHRAITLAHWFEEQSLAEIARRQDLTERVVKSRLDEAHAILRRRMDTASGGREVWSLAFLKWTEPHLAAGATAGAGTALTLGGIVMASKLVVGSVAVVLAAGLGWMLWPRSEPLVPVSKSVGPPDAHAADTTTSADGLAQGAVASARETVAMTDPRLPTPAASSPQRWIVRGHVRGAPPGRETETKLTAQFIGRFNVQDKVEGRPASDGSFEFDISEGLTPWLGSGEPNDLRVRAEHLVCQVAEVNLPYSTDKRVYECEIALKLGAVVTGRVAVPAGWKPGLGWSGEPLRPDVALFDGSQALTQQRDGLDHAECDVEGRWTLRANHEGNFRVIAAVDGLRPASREVVLSLGQCLDAGTIELERGATISGHARAAGKPPPEGTLVMARKKYQSASIGVPSRGSLSLGSISTAGGELEYAFVRARTHADGSYEICGLAAEEYDVQVQQLAGLRMGVDERARFGRSVRAPQSGVDLEDLPPCFELALTVSGRPPTDADLQGLVLDLVSLSRENRTFAIDLTRSAAGYGRIQVDPDVSYEVRIPAGRYAASTLSLGTLQFGDQKVFPLDLQPDDQSSTLIVRVPGRSADAHDPFEFRFIDSSAARADSGKSVAPSKVGTFDFPNLPPGSYEVLVKPFDYWAPADTSYYLPAEFAITLPPKATVEHELRLGIGGRMRVSAKDERGGRLDAAVELRDGTGTKLETEFYGVTNEGLWKSTWSISARGPADHAPLPAGHYELTIAAEGFAPEVFPVDLIAGETTTLDVVLHPK